MYQTMPELPKRKKTKQEIEELEKVLAPFAGISDLVNTSKLFSTAIVPQFKPVIFSPPPLINPIFLNSINKMTDSYKLLSESIYVAQLSKSELISSLTTGLKFYNAFAEAIERMISPWKILANVVLNVQKNLSSMIEILNKPLLDPSFFRIVTPSIQLVERYQQLPEIISPPHLPTRSQDSTDYMEERRLKQNKLLDLQIVFYERQIALMEGDKPGTVKISQEVRPLSAISLRNPTKQIKLQESSEVIHWLNLSLNIETGTSYYNGKYHKFALNKPHYHLLKILIKNQEKEVKWSDFFIVINDFLADKPDFDTKREYVKLKIREIRRLTGTPKTRQ
jgi:hypothetical protein